MKYFLVSTNPGSNLEECQFTQRSELWLKRELGSERFMVLDALPFDGKVVRVDLPPYKWAVIRISDRENIRRYGVGYIECRGAWNDVAPVVGLDRVDEPCIDVGEVIEYEDCFVKRFDDEEDG